MKMMDSSELAKNYKAGDIVWGCVYAYRHEDGDGEALNVLPTKGMLAPCRYEKDLATAKPYISYFIPLKKDGKTPSWKKAIPIYSLHYATTELECIEIYNGLIDSNIQWHKSEIGRLKKDLIKIPKAKLAQLTAAAAASTEATE